MTTATDPPEGSTTRKPEKIPLSARPFSHKPPYAPELAERVPVLQAFSLAIANYVRLQAAAASAGQERVPFLGAECGVFSGNSLMACAGLARDSGIDFRLLGFDTFTGLPELSATDRQLAPSSAPYLRKTMFTETSYEGVAARVAEAGLQREISLHQGLFAQTLPKLAEAKYHFVNIDCDLYEPHLECLEYFYPRMVPGAVVFFDDYHSKDYPMAGKAVDHFMAGVPEQLMHLRFGPDAANRTKSFFIKY